MSRQRYRNTPGPTDDYTGAWIGGGLTVLAMLALVSLIVFLPDNPTMADARVSVPTAEVVRQSPPALGVIVSRSPMPESAHAEFWPRLLDIADPYDRCLLAMDAAHLAVELCEPLPHPSPSRPQRPKVQEDSPRWSCRTMGNRVCSQDQVVYGSRARIV